MCFYIWKILNDDDINLKTKLTNQQQFLRKTDWTILTILENRKGSKLVKLWGWQIISVKSQTWELPSKSKQPFTGETDHLVGLFGSPWYSSWNFIREKNVGNWKDCWAVTINPRINNTLCYRKPQRPVDCPPTLALVIILWSPIPLQLKIWPIIVNETILTWSS